VIHRLCCSPRTVARACVAVFLALLGAHDLIAADALTQHYNNARTGAVLDETRLTTSNVNTAGFGKLWTLYADGQIVAQPLYVSGLKIDTSGNPPAPLVQGTFNAVVIATMHNTVYLYDADSEKPGPQGRTVPLWATWLGEPRKGGKDIDMWSTNDPEWGILGTPVVSADKSTLYVVAWHGDAPGLRYMVHALNMQNGAHRLPPKLVGVGSTDPSNPCRNQSAFNPCVHKQRAALLLSNDVLYVGFGGDGNRGALFAIDAKTLDQRAFWSSTPSGGDGGIWQSGQGPAADAAGNVYLMTGNGSFDAANGNYGNSVVKLALEGNQIVVKDFFTPCNFQFLNQLDLDLGSGGPVLLPGTPSRIVGGGKEGVLYVLSRTNMGKHTGAAGANCQNTNIVQQVKAFDVAFHDGQNHYGNIHGSPVFWQGPDNGRIYAWGENSQLKAYTFSQGRLQNVANPKRSAFRPPDGMPGGMLTLSANGNKAGTGILWALVPLNGDANQQRGVFAILLALDAQDVSRTLWTSEQFVQRDRVGLFAKFNPPLVANGKVFVPTYGNTEPLRQYGGGARPNAFPSAYYVAVYGRIAAMPARPVVDQDRDDVTVLKAATSPLTLNVAQCTPIDDTSVDCTEQLTQSSNLPAFHRVVMARDQNVAGCALLRVTTVSRNGGLADSTGIGFWSTQAANGNLAPENSGRFITTGALRPAGGATLANGTPATLHEFVGVANCPAGDTTLDRLFKPFMQFENSPDGRIFHNWDLAENYRISTQITQFDRSTQILR